MSHFHPIAGMPHHIPHINTDTPIDTTGKGQDNTKVIFYNNQPDCTGAITHLCTIRLLVNKTQPEAHGIRCYVLVENWKRDKSEVTTIGGNYSAFTEVTPFKETSLRRKYLRKELPLCDSTWAQHE